MLFALPAAALALQAQSGKTKLKVGDTAPEFDLPSTKGGRVKLSDLKGSTVVLAFFPAAFTGGCTKEMTAYGQELAKFQGMGAKVFGVSTDNVPSQKHWAEQVLKVEQPLLSDFMRKASKDYGVLMEDRGIANRTTFVIDGEGKIQHIEEGSAAVDITSAVNACSRLKKS